MKEHDLEKLRALLGKEVVVSGLAHYHLGEPLILELEAIDLARAEDRLFRKRPLPQSQKPVFEALPQDSHTGVAAFFGTWPGEESDEELLQALEVLK